MSNKANKAVLAVQRIMLAVVETIKECGTRGAPESAVFLAFQSEGCALPLFNKIIGLMIDEGLIRKSGNLLLPA
jgi:hypothetical protein